MLLSRVLFPAPGWPVIVNLICCTVGITNPALIPETPWRSFGISRPDITDVIPATWDGVVAAEDLATDVRLGVGFLDKVLVILLFLPFNRVKKLFFSPVVIYKIYSKGLG